LRFLAIENGDLTRQRLDEQQPVGTWDRSNDGGARQLHGERGIMGA
jgi:hypothetical protein